MNRRLVVLLVLLVVLVTVCLSVRPVAAKERQPHMTAALRHLEAAAAELREAERDKGGHREKALEATENAIRHVKEGIAYDAH